MIDDDEIWRALMRERQAKVFKALAQKTVFSIVFWVPVGMAIAALINGWPK